MLLIEGAAGGQDPNEEAAAETIEERAAAHWIKQGAGCENVQSTAHNETKAGGAQRGRTVAGSGSACSCMNNCSISKLHQITIWRSFGITFKNSANAYI